MDYEKKYKELVEAIKQLQETNPSDEGIQNWANDVLYGTEETVNERIRKDIIVLVKDWWDRVNKDNISTKEQMLAWLEKQGHVKESQDSQRNNKPCKENGYTLTNEDELIRKAQLDYWRSVGGKEWHGVPAQETITWLEKQGQKSAEWHREDEQNLNACLSYISDEFLRRWLKDAIYAKYNKSADKVEPKFHKGDWCIDNEDGVIFQIVKVLDNTYTYKTNEGKEYSCTHYSLENDAKHWTIADAKDGDVLYLQKDGKEHIIIYKGIIKERFRTFVSAYCAYNGIVDDFCFADVSRYADIAYGDIMLATKDQCDFLFKKMREAGMEWDKKKKELKKIEDEEYNGEDYGIDSLFHAQRILEKTLGKVDGYQTDDGILSHKCAIFAVKKLYKEKSCWSEEDEHRLKDTIYFLDTAKKHYASTVELDSCIDWLKSLKDRN